MALVLKDRVKESSTSSGTGSVTLAGAFTGYQTFASAVASGSTVYYTIHNTTSPNDGEWEVGVGTFTSPSTLSRDTVFSSSTGGTKVSFSAASVLEVFITQPASEAVYINDATGRVEAFGNGANTITFTNINTTNLVANTVTLTAGTISTNAANATDIVNKQYVDGIVAAGVHYHAPVLVESPTALIATYNQPGGAGNGVGATLTNSGSNVALVIDGVTLSNTARVLVYTQSNAVQNGVYTVTNPGNVSAQWVLTRATDADTYVVASSAGLSEGSTFFVQSGNTGAGEVYTCTTPGTITFGTTNITFAQIGSAQIYSAGTGLSLTNTTFSLVTPVATTNGGTGLTTFTAANNAIYSTGASTLTAGTLPIAAGGTGSTIAPAAITNLRGWETTVTAAGTTTLTNTSATQQNFTGSTTQTLVLPVTSTLALGWAFEIINNSTGTITVNSSGGNLVGTVIAGTTASIVCNLTSGTTETSWDFDIDGFATETGTGAVARATAPSFAGITATGALQLNGSAGTLVNLHTAATTGVFNLGGTAGTGTMTIGRSTASQTTNIQAGATASGSTKTINLGTEGLTGSTTTINIGSANGTTVTVNGTANLSGNVNIGGSISGNGASLSAINASNISSGTIANARTTAASANGASTIVQRDSSGSFDANLVNAVSLSGNAATVTNINASNIASGTIANARTTASSSNGASTIVLRGASGEFAAGAITGTSFSGNGSALTAINATAITSGTLDNARTNATTANGASTLVVRDANGSFAGNVITGTTGTFTNISGNATSLTAINASNISSGTIANARTTAASANGASTIVLRGTSGEFSAGIITADGSGLSAINASNISSGTVASARISGSYTGITGVGTLTAGTWNANVIGNVYTTANSANGASTIVARDSNGSFTANVGTFTTVSGAGGGLTSINASSITLGTLDNARTTASASNGANTIVLRGASGEFAAGAITASGNLSVTGSVISATANAAASVEGIFTNTNAGTAASAGVQGKGNSTGYWILRQYGTGVTASVFGQTLANYALLASDGASSNGLMLGSLTADPVIFGTNNAERMRIDSSGAVGIGVTNPSYKLDLASADTTASLGYAIRIRANATAAAGSIQFTNANASTENAVISADTSNNMKFSTASAERMRITSAGAVSFGSSGTAYGTAGQYLQSSGSGASPVWKSISYGGTYLVVAGGGGGGEQQASVTNGGGGGAGGFLTGSATFIVGSVYTVTVGAGGAVNNNGSDSILVGIATAIGGGFGAGVTAARAGGNGGSGGGGSAAGGGGAGGSGTFGQGTVGGSGSDGGNYLGGGGGGASTAGDTGSSTGNGGAGTASSITGSSVTYAGGGGGGGNSGQFGAGGAGGGGRGGTNVSNSAVAGTANSGGGGGGSANNTGFAAAGGSGVIIISVPSTNYSGVTTGSPTITTSGSNTIIKFTASGTYTA